MGKILYPKLHNKNWLQEEYVVKNKSMATIANEVGTKPCVVLDALRKNEIESRGRGEHKLGVPHSPEHSEKISQALKGKEKPWMLNSGNPNWQGGRTKEIQMERTTVRYKNWKESVFNRDIFCANCDSTENRVAHHIKPYQEYPELKFDISNGTVLCRSCHSTYHNSQPVKMGLIRRTSVMDNAEPAEVIA